MSQIGKTRQNRYRIDRLIGSGGFGYTYLGVDLHLPGKPECVIKHLQPKNSNPNVLKMATQRLELEAKNSVSARQ
ncbi:MAG: hypothetical protein HC908_13050 [Calothrix sp. SM1_7_51]|nr:hypothetical protein [Calothrix sp. SM1_7_51]